jgi:hypothetical protein
VAKSYPILVPFGSILPPYLWFLENIGRGGVNTPPYLKGRGGTLSLSERGGTRSLARRVLPSLLFSVRKQNSKKRGSICYLKIADTPLREIKGGSGGLKALAQTLLGPCIRGYLRDRNIGGTLDQG